MAVNQKVAADEIPNLRFNTVKLHTGYNMEEVDSFIDRVESTLRDYESKVSTLKTTVDENQKGSSTIESDLC